MGAMLEEGPRSPPMCLLPHSMFPSNWKCSFLLSDEEEGIRYGRSRKREESQSLTCQGSYFRFLRGRLREAVGRRHSAQHTGLGTEGPARSLASFPGAS